ncbi:hypothetical protein ScPMuIL_014576 [Solemya velum]
MSLGSKVALGGAIGFSISIIYYVHHKQTSDKERMREGIVRDIERQQSKKAQNLKRLQDQIEITQSVKRSEAEERRQLLKQSEAESTHDVEQKV